MATRSETFRADEQRKGRARASKKPSESKKPSRAKQHAGRKATFALEDGDSKKKSRKSSRKSANRAKPESTLEIREQMQRSTPEAVHERRGH